MPTSDPTSNDSAKAEATFFRPQDEIQVHRGNLPHWRQDCVTYFVTTRLADSMPQEKLLEWQQKRDAGHGECQLRRPDVRGLLMSRLSAEHSLDAWVIMPNRLHALVAPQDKPLGDVLQSWKGGSAFEINRLLGLRGPLWKKSHMTTSTAANRSCSTTAATSQRIPSKPT